MQQKEAFYAAKYGIKTILQYADWDQKVPYCWPHNLRSKYLMIVGSDLSINTYHELLPILEDMRNNPQTSETLHILGPPTGTVNDSCSDLG